MVERVGAGRFGRVSSGPGRLGALQVPRPSVKREVRLAAQAMSGVAIVGQVARAGTAVVAELAEALAESVGGPPVVHVSRVVVILSRQSRQTVARAGAAVHGGDRSSWYNHLCGASETKENQNQIEEIERNNKFNVRPHLCHIGLNSQAFGAPLFRQAVKSLFLGSLFRPPPEPLLIKSD